MVTYRFKCKRFSVNTHLSILITIIFLKKHNVYLTEIKKENSSNFFFTIVNEKLLYLKILPSFQPLPQAVPETYWPSNFLAPSISEISYSCIYLRL